MIRLTPPTVAKYVSSGWGAPRDYRKGWHAGLDFPAPKGSPVLAAAAGTVSKVKNYDNSFAGKYTVIDHGNGISTRYLHNDSNSKRVGDRVARGEQIGTVGTTGTKHSGAHVHFDTRLTPAALVEYSRRYGTPSPGFSRKLFGGRAVPVETFMSGAQYKKGIIEASVGRGVKLFRANAFTIGGVALAAGAGWLLYRYVLRRR